MGFLLSQPSRVLAEPWTAEAWGRFACRMWMAFRRTGQGSEHPGKRWRSISSTACVDAHSWAWWCTPRGQWHTPMSMVVHSWTWWYTPMSTLLRQLSPEGCEFQAIVGYKARPLKSSCIGWVYYPYHNLVVILHIYLVWWFVVLILLIRNLFLGGWALVRSQR